jgi:dTDP-4-dehydrorhamnose reductase
MILVLGATGYIGRAFVTELQRRGTSFVPLTRKALDYTQFDVLFEYLRRNRPDFLINAAGYTGRPNVDACEEAKADTLQGNTLFPQTVARVCALTHTPWGHVSSGCIYAGAKVEQEGVLVVERDLSQPRLRQLFAEHPDRFLGFSEFDPPNFSFRSLPCSFYSGTKALAEEALQPMQHGYIWRLRIPFDEFDDSRNYLSKIQKYPKVYDNINSLSHRGDFVRACLDLWEKRAPWGTYNLTNPGAVTTRQVAEKIKEELCPNRSFEYWESDEEFYRVAAKTPRSNCILDTSKLIQAGVKMRSVAQALEEAIERWQPAGVTSALKGCPGKTITNEPLLTVTHSDVPAADRRSLSVSSRA